MPRLQRTHTFVPSHIRPKRTKHTMRSAFLARMLLMAANLHAQTSSPISADPPADSAYPESRVELWPPTVLNEEAVFKHLRVRRGQCRFCAGGMMCRAGAAMKQPGAPCQQGSRAYRNLPGSVSLFDRKPKEVSVVRKESPAAITPRSWFIAFCSIPGSAMTEPGGVFACRA